MLILWYYWPKFFAHWSADDTISVDLTGTGLQPKWVCVDYARSLPAEGAPGSAVSPPPAEATLSPPWTSPPPASWGRWERLPLWRRFALGGAVPVRGAVACRFCHQPDYWCACIRASQRFTCWWLRPAATLSPDQHPQSPHHQPEPQPQSFLWSSSDIASLWLERIHTSQEYSRWVQWETVDCVQHHEWGAWG